MSTQDAPASPLGSGPTLLFCRMCQAVYRQPKLLPCLHSFCRPCLEDAVTHGVDGAVIVCPLCSHRTRVPPGGGGVMDIPDNCFLTRMCQDYIAEVQSHLIARSMHSTINKPSEFTQLRSKLTQELSHLKYTPPASPTLRHSSQEEDKLHTEDRTLSNVTDHDSGLDPSTDSALEAIHNMSRLQAKIMSLQGEALKVTYSIDQVNQCMVEWHDHKEDLKRAVQRRSSQFQFFIKRMENQLISQIDGKHADDDVYAESDRSKDELRKGLKNILHEVSVLKSLQEYGNNAEVNFLSSSLLGKSVGMSDVLLKKFHYEMNVPTQAIEDLVAECFGEITLSSEDLNVFAPDILDFTEMPVGNGAEPFSDVLETIDHNDVDVHDGSLQNMSSERSFGDRRSRKHSTDISSAKPNVNEHLTQFQNAQETLRTRRREILVRGQRAREDVSPLRDEVFRLPAPTYKRGRVHSLDRVAMFTTRKSKSGLSLTSDHSATAMSSSEEENAAFSNTKEGLLKKQGINFQYRTGVSHSAHGLIPEDRAVPSPVIEEVAFTQYRLVKQRSDPRSEYDQQPLPELASSMPTGSPQTQSKFKSESSRHRRFSSPGSSLFTGRRHSSEQCTSLPQHKDMTLDLVQDGSNRLVRRAISSGADRKTKIEFLRENWQKRKEILIQNEGFLSSDNFGQHSNRAPTQIKSTEVPQTISTQIHAQEMHISLPSSPSIQIPHEYTLRKELSTSQAEPTKISPKLAQASNFHDDGSPPLATQDSSSQRTEQVAKQLTMPTSTTSATETNAETPSTTTRHTKFPIKHSESIDVASLIAAMYSGKERSIIHSKADADTGPSSKPAEEKIGNASTLIRNSQQTESCAASSAPSDPVPSTSSSAGTFHNPARRRQTPARTSTFSNGVNRRHTIEIGKTMIEKAQQITAGSKDSSITAAPGSISHAISVSPTSHHHHQDRQVLHSRSQLGASNEPYTAQPPTADSSDAYRDPSVKHKTTSLIKRSLPSPVEITQNSAQHDGAAASTSATPPSPSSTPTSPNLNDGSQKVRLREIARKKKERWRHLTIH